MSLSSRSQLALAGLDNSDVEDAGDQFDFQSASSGRAQLLAEALKTAQLQLDVERSHNHKLKEQNTILEASKPKRSKKNVPPELLAYEGEIRTLAKKYGVVTELFFP
ncbi:hypothetical protein EDC04DRAFT_2908329 [Pisolithus marmoratus]|nr:hypothetical protein EDC04DRAFT_2908329 [Pisolithus marmoratus]